MRIVLASASARRHELLKRLIPQFDIIASGFDESSVRFDGSLGTYVMEMAEGKVNDVSERVEEDTLIIGCDTIVAFDDKILGKPRDEQEACEMLKNLSGRTHSVYSGLVVFDKKKNVLKKTFVRTDVKFSDLSDEAIRRYVSSGEPMDKAGAYGIQGNGAIFVEEIHGCYYNVVGLPLNKLNDVLREIGVNLF